MTNPKFAKVNKNTPKYNISDYDEQQSKPFGTYQNTVTSKSKTGYDPKALHVVMNSMNNKLVQGTPGGKDAVYQSPDGKIGLMHPSGEGFVFYNPKTQSPQLPPPVQPIVKQPIPATTIVNETPRKPVVIGTAGTYNPNNNTNYIDPSMTKKNPAILERYKKGGLVKFIKGYADGGQTEDNSKEVAAAIGMGAGMLGDFGSNTINSTTQDIYGRTDTGSKLGDYSAGVGSGLMAGAGKGAAAGASLGPYGVIIGAGLGAATGAVTGAIKTKKDRDSIEAEKNAIELDKIKQNQIKAQQLFDYSRNKALEERMAGMKKGGMVLKAPVGKAKGGKIEGAGTGTSDSIHAKVKPSSFVVPKKNAEVAEELKEKVLGTHNAKEEKAELNQKDGSHVKLSNGEFLFTPEEYKELLAKGIDLKKLAPDAEENAEGERSHGGLTASKAKIMLKDNQANGKPLSPAQKRYFGWIAGGSKADGGMVEGYAKGGEVKGGDKEKRKQYLQNQIENLSSSQSSLDKILLNKYKKELASLSSGNKSNVVEVKKTTIPNTGLSVETMRKLKPDINNKVVEGERPLVVPKPQQGDGVMDLRQDAVPKADKGSNKSDNGNKIDKLKALGIVGNEAANLATGLTNYIIPAKQTRMGLEFLNKSGARPVDEVDRGFQETVNRANANAKFGYTPEEQAYLNMQNNNLLNAQKNAARNYSGGSSGNAYNMERDASNEAFGRGLEATIAGRKLQMNKQQYADDLNMAKADKMRQLFNDRMEGWNMNQKAGASLLGAGLRNMIGANRYSQELIANQNTNNIGNSWLNNIGG